jgi:hypothetical protein
MILLAEAERAKEVAKILDTFRGSDPNNQRAIETTIVRLDDLSLVLRDLDRQIEVRDGVVSKIAADDLELLQHSVAYTLGDIWMILGDMPDECIGHDYRAAWKDIVANCRSAGNQSIHMRIDTYAVFAAALCRLLRG